MCSSPLPLHFKVISWGAHSDPLSEIPSFLALNTRKTGDLNIHHLPPRFWPNCSASPLKVPAGWERVEQALWLGASVSSSSMASRRGPDLQLCSENQPPLETPLGSKLPSNSKLLASPFWNCLLCFLIPQSTQSDNTSKELPWKMNGFAAYKTAWIQNMIIASKNIGKY